MKKYILYVFPFTLVFISPWVYRMSLENILLAVPRSTFETASNAAWCITAAVAFLSLFAAAVADVSR